MKKNKIEIMFIFFIFIFNLSFITETKSINEIEYIFEDRIHYKSGSFQFREDDNSLYSSQSLPKPELKKRSEQLSITYTGEEPTIYETVLKKIAPGKDGRTRIKGTLTWPNTIYTQLEVYFGNKNLGRGSGVLVGPHHVLTCGHNVFTQQHELGWAESIKVHPALNDKAAPFGSIKVIKAYTFKQWVNDRDPSFDIALLVLERSIGFNTGWAGMLSSSSDESLKELDVSITGYPADKSAKSLQLWTMKHMLKETRQESFSYEIDTYAGQSGSPIINTNPNGGIYVIGIHTQGGKNENYGVRLSHTKFKDHVIRWIKNTYCIDSESMTSSLNTSDPRTLFSGGTLPFLLSSSNSSHNKALQFLSFPQSQPTFNSNQLSTSLPGIQSSSSSFSPLGFSSPAASFSSRNKINKTPQKSVAPKRRQKLNRTIKAVPSSLSKKTEVNLSSLVQKKVGLKIRNFKDNKKTARVIVAKISEKTDRKSIARSLNIDTKVLNNFIEEKGRSDAKIVDNIIEKIKNSKSDFYKMAKKAAKK